MPENIHSLNPFYRAEIPGDFCDACWRFQTAIADSYARLNARAEARFEEECIQFSRPLDKPPKVNEV